MYAVIDPTAQWPHAVDHFSRGWFECIIFTAFLMIIIIIMCFAVRFFFFCRRHNFTMNNTAVAQGTAVILSKNSSYSGMVLK